MISCNMTQPRANTASQSLDRMLGVVVITLCLANLSFGQRPNVILILTDDQGYGDVSLHGNPVLETPSLDQLAKESVRFTDFHVAPMCSPTRGQLMTGIDAMRNGCTAVCQGPLKTHALQSGIRILRVKNVTHFTGKLEARHFLLQLPSRLVCP